MPKLEKIEHEIPDVETDIALPADGQVFEFLAVVDILEVGKFRTTVQKNMTDGTGLQAERTELEAKQ